MARAVDARTDLYSLGVTLFEMLTDSSTFERCLGSPCTLILSLTDRKQVLVPAMPKVVSAIVGKLRWPRAGAALSDPPMGVAWDRSRRCRSSMGGRRGDVPVSLRTITACDCGCRSSHRTRERSAGGGRSLRARSTRRGGAVAPSALRIGKTALVRTWYLDIARSGRGLCSSIKHDQLASARLYAALAQAFSGLCGSGWQALKTCLYAGGNACAAK